MLTTVSGWYTTKQLLIQAGMEYIYENIHRTAKYSDTGCSTMLRQELIQELCVQQARGEGIMFPAVSAMC